MGQPEERGEEEAALRTMFDIAAAELSKEEREDRDLLLGAFDAVLTV